MLVACCLVCTIAGSDLSPSEQDAQTPVTQQPSTTIQNIQEAYTLLLRILVGRDTRHDSGPCIHALIEADVSFKSMRDSFPTRRFVSPIDGEGILAGFMAHLRLLYHLTSRD